VKKTAIALLCAFSVASCAQFPSASNERWWPAPPCISKTALGMATVTSLIVLMEVKRQKVQETLKNKPTRQVLLNIKPV
jgi:NADH:ubiquinone oxidoreductase subunit 6 (subunit J)